MHQWRIPALSAVGVLLLSGCGLNHVPPTAPPGTPNREFILWQGSDGERSKVVGTGRIIGYPDGLGSYFHLIYPPCATDHPDFNASGSRVPGTSSAKLSNGFNLTVDMSFLSPASPSFDAIPATGTLHLRRQCPAGTDGPFQAEAPPELGGSWQPSTGDQAAAIQIREEFLVTGYSALVDRSALILAGDACFTTAADTMTGAVELRRLLFRRTYKLRNGSTLVADTPVGALRSKPVTALKTRYTLHGGACDGRTLSVMLRHP